MLIEAHSKKREEKKEIENFSLIRKQICRTLERDQETNTVVATNNENVLRVLDFICEEKADCLQ